jgi:hypothetical protein
VALAAFTGTDDFAEREEDGFMGNIQYIADRRPLCLPVFTLQFLWMPELPQT